MHRAYGAQQPALHVMEGLQSSHSRPESDLSGSHGRGRPAGTGSVRVNAKIIGRFSPFLMSAIGH